ncbi:hypothetical protein BSL78_18913 [Apostichopus japonicus]|uniref:Uncharacterized protein n=1 Tax=Stichopus japonicus TaxID=307972 RepID=A0A2G8K897_STIJA|nr:hypothetical protein BSL78_18913 [Apostichopus japonicus]
MSLISCPFLFLAERIYDIVMACVRRDRTNTPRQIPPDDYPPDNNPRTITTRTDTPGQKPSRTTTPRTTSTRTYTRTITPRTKKHNPDNNLVGRIPLDNYPRINTPDEYSPGHMPLTIVDGCSNGYARLFSRLTVPRIQRTYLSYLTGTHLQYTPGWRGPVEIKVPCSRTYDIMVRAGIEPTIL